MLQINSWLTNLTPLELYLKDKSDPREDKRNHFPGCGENYFTYYIKAKEIFQREYYNEIEESANVTESDGTVYTKHGIPHVRALIHETEKIIIWNSDPRTIRISGYEAFLLLMSVLLHDTGMFFGRKNHEKMCQKIINKHYKEIGISRDEAITIGRIAEAHSGKDNDGNPEDTLAQLNPLVTYVDTQYRERMIASIIRFADELSDTPDRAYNFVEKKDSVNDYSKLCHAYCKSITGVKTSPLAQTVSINYSMSFDIAQKVYNTKCGQLYLSDFILERLEKMEQERAYCTRNFSDAAYIATIKAELRIYSLDAFDFHTELFKEVITIGENLNYPGRKSLRDSHPNFIGTNLIELLNTQKRAPA